MADSATKHLEMSFENPNLRIYILNHINPFVKGDVLEIGCGLGACTSYFKAQGKVTPIDINPEYIKQVPGAINHDISKSPMSKRFDTIVAINVLEHILDEPSAIANMKKSLKPDGNIILVLPAYSWLFGHVDTMIGHHRRYSADSIFTMIKYQNLYVEEIFHLNSLGIFGWWLTKKLGRDTVNPKSLYIYDKLIPLVKFVDRYYRYSWGLNLVAVLRKI